MKQLNNFYYDVLITPFDNKYFFVNTSIFTGTNIHVNHIQKSYLEIGQLDRNMLRDSLNTFRMLLRSIEI